MSEKKIITTVERTTKFNEWLLTQNMPKYNEVKSRQKWWISKVIEFDKKLNEEGWEVCDTIRDK